MAHPRMPRLIVEVAFSTADPTALHLDDPERGRLGTARLGADVWTDLAEETKIESATLRSGSTRVDSPLIRFEPGTASIAVDDPDGRYDPTNLDGPYVSAGRTQITAMRRVRVRAEWAGVVYPLWSGYTDLWDVDWTPTKGTAVIQATDGFKVLAARRRGAVAPVGEGETSDQRVNRILDSVGWPAEQRQIGPGSTTLQATTLEGDPLAEAQLTADTEIGEFYMGRDGRAVFRGRTALLTDPRSATSQATFGHRPGVSELPIATDDAQLYNEVLITRVGGQEQRAADPGSMEELLPRTFERSDLLMQTDEEAAAYAAWVLHVSAEPEVRFDTITIFPMSDPDVLWPQVLGREIGDRITCYRTRPKGRPPLVRDAFIRGIQHEIGPSSWRTTWTLQSATRAGSWFTLDQPANGRLDSNALAY